MTTEGTLAREVIQGTWKEANAISDMCIKNHVRVKFVRTGKTQGNNAFDARGEIIFTSHNWLALQRCVNQLKRNRAMKIERETKANLRKFAR